MRGWTQEGFPTVEKLNEIGLSDLVDIVKPKIEKPKRKVEKES